MCKVDAMFMRLILCSMLFQEPVGFLGLFSLHGLRCVVYDQGLFRSIRQQYLQNHGWPNLL